MAGFHIGVRGKAAGQVVRCTAREGACKLTGADGEPTQHFASLADGEAYLAEQENVSKGGFIAAAGNNASETSDDADATTTRLYTCRHEHPIRDTLALPTTKHPTPPQERKHHGRLR